MNDRNIRKHNNHGKIKKLYFLRHIFLNKNAGSYKLCTKSILIVKSQILEIPTYTNSRSKYCVTFIYFILILKWQFKYYNIEASMFSLFVRIAKTDR